MKLREEILYILQDYGDFFLTDYPHQADTKSIHPTTNKLLKLFRSWALEEKIELIERIGKELPNHLLVANKFLGREVEVEIRKYLSDLKQDKQREIKRIKASIIAVKKWTKTGELSDMIPERIEEAK